LITNAGHVLLAEDNPINQMVAEKLLASLDYSCEVAKNGSEAVAMAIAKKYDLIFMDYHMPVLDGVLATEQIRELGSDSLNFNTPIIALTADTQHEVREHFQQAGANDTLLKPFTRDKLAQCLHKWSYEIVGKSDVPKAVNDSVGLPILAHKQLDEVYEMSADTGAEIVGQIIRLYLQHSPMLIEQIQQAEMDNNNEALFKAAHSLKSSSGTIGALRLQYIAKSIEYIGRGTGDMGNVKELILGLTANFEDVKQALNERAGAII
jgi:two-component system, sensor histidine kinase